MFQIFIFNTTEKQIPDIYDSTQTTYDYISDIQHISWCFFLSLGLRIRHDVSLLQIHPHHNGKQTPFFHFLQWHTSLSPLNPHSSSNSDGRPGHWTAHHRRTEHACLSSSSPWMRWIMFLFWGSICFCCEFRILIQLLQVKVE